MNKETLRMQMLSGVITEGEYKAKLKENPESSFEDLKTRASSLDNFEDMGNSFSFQYDNNDSKTGEKIATITVTLTPSSDPDKVTVKYFTKSVNPDEYEKMGAFTTRTVNQPIGGVKMWLNSLKRRSSSPLNENFVGMGMVGNIFDRERSDYELAFEHFTKGKMMNEDNTSSDTYKKNLLDLIIAGEKQLVDLEQLKGKVPNIESSIAKAKEVVDGLKASLKGANKIKEIEGDPDDYYGYQEPIDPKDYADDLEEKISKDDEKLYRAFIKAANFLKGGGSDDEAWEMMWDEYPYM